MFSCLYLSRSGISGSYDHSLIYLGMLVFFLSETSGFIFSGLPRVYEIRKVVSAFIPIFFLEI